VIPDYPPGAEPTSFSTIDSSVLAALMVKCATSGDFDDPEARERWSRYLAVEAPHALRGAATLMVAPAWRNPEWDQERLDVARNVVGAARSIKDRCN